MLHYEVDGDPAREPLVLLHGFTGSTRSWDDVRSALAARFRLVLVDLVGHGRSPSPADVRCYSFDRCVADVSAVLDALGVERVRLLGYSMGGRVALRFAADCPERIRTLLLESASPGIASTAERAARIAADNALADRIGRHGVQAFVSEWEQQPLLALAPHVPRHVRQAQHEQRLSNSPLGLANSLRGMGAGQQEPLWDSLALLTMPVRLLVGADDARYRDIAERMLPLLPNADLSVVEDAGHTVHLDQPARFVEWAIA